MFYKDRRYGIDMEATGRKIDRVLRIKGITTKGLAEAFNISEQSVSKWRHGRSLPELQNFYLLAQLLGVRIDDLLVSVGERYRLRNMSWYVRIFEETYMVERMEETRHARQIIGRFTKYRDLWKCQNSQNSF